EEERKAEQVSGCQQKCRRKRDLGKSIIDHRDLNLKPAQHNAVELYLLFGLLYSDERIVLRKDRVL
ncbi:MAG TPA: hypothetical protein VF458_15915, partial [Ktedonobacteraceae bacterium]